MVKVADDDQLCVEDYGMKHIYSQFVVRSLCRKTKQPETQNFDALDILKQHSLPRLPLPPDRHTGPRR